MGRIRAGLKFNIGKHGRIWVPIGGGGKKKRKSAPARSGSRAEEAPERGAPEASVGVSIILGLMSLLLFVGLAFGIVAVGSFVRHKSAGDVLIGIISAAIALAGLYYGALGLVSLISCVKELKAKKAARAEAAATVRLAEEGMEKTARFSFYLVPEEDEELQAKLRTWKLRGGTVELALRADDQTGEVSFAAAGAYVGRPGEQAAAWIRENFDSIRGIAAAAVRGGGHDLEGKPRLFTMYVTLDLQTPAVHPKAEASPLPVVRDAFGFDGDRVCVLSGTGKIHTCPPGCGIGDAGLKRYLLDDLDEEKHSLCLKCYKDYF